MTATLEPLPEGMRPLATEVETYYRELPRLLEEGGKGLYVVVKGNQTYGIWDTYRDAKQFAYQKFPDSVFLAQPIDARMLPILARHFGSIDKRETA